MEQREQNDKRNRIEGGSACIYETIEGAYYGDGAVVRYSYRLVYTQESLWVLDMRHDTDDVRSDRLVRAILRARARGSGYRADGWAGTARIAPVFPKPPEGGREEGGRGEDRCGDEA